MYIEVTYSNDGILGKVIEYYPQYNENTMGSTMVYHWGSRLVSWKVLGTSLA